MNLEISVDEYFSEANKKLIYKTITIFQNFELIRLEGPISSLFKIDGRLFCSETSGYNFYVSAVKSGFNIQVLKKPNDFYEFGIYMTRENDKIEAVAYHKPSD